MGTAILDVAKLPIQIPTLLVEKQEIKRYSRQILLPEIGILGQEKLQKSRILVIGAGGLGCPILQYLAAAGVGHIGIVDDDSVDVSNLHRQILFNFQDIGHNKALTACEKLKFLNPNTHTIAYPVRLTSENANSMIHDYDLVIDGSDNFPTRYITNDACIALNRPFIFGSILKFEGQVSVFNHQGGPSYRDLFPHAEDGENCEFAGVLNILPGIIGMFMANEAIKVICGFGEVLSGKLLFYNALTNSTQIFTFSEPKMNPLPSVTAPKSSITELDIKVLENASQSPTSAKYFVVDVREEYEHEEDPIGEVNIPLSDLPDYIDTLESKENITFYCPTGRRSQIAAKFYIQENPTKNCYWMKQQ